MENRTPTWRARLARYLVRLLVGTALLVAGSAFVPYWWCSRQADGWCGDNPANPVMLAHGVEAWLDADLARTNFHTGSTQFNGEWLFGTYMLAGMGFGQLAEATPQRRALYLKNMTRCIDRLLSPEVRAFDREMWGEDPIDSLGGDRDHAAYLGYLNLLLSFHRRLAGESPYAELNDHITAVLVTRLEDSPTMLLDSYPGEIYPVDNTAVIASLGQYGRATGADCRPLVEKWVRNCRAHYVDDRSGLLYQAIDPATGQPVDRPRGSGTCLALYFLSFADPVFSEDLYLAARKHLARSVFGFGAMREYLPGTPDAMGDIDSGPVVLGYGLSATGFMIAGARLHGDADTLRRLAATAHVWGAPVERGGRMNFVTGGCLGDAILLAMFTAEKGTAE